MERGTSGLPWSKQNYFNPLKAHFSPGFSYLSSCSIKDLEVILSLTLFLHPHIPITLWTPRPPSPTHLIYQKDLSALPPKCILNLAIKDLRSHLYFHLLSGLQLKPSNRLFFLHSRPFMLSPFSGQRDLKTESDHVHKETRYLHSYVHCSTIHNSQEWKQPTCPPTDGWIKKMWYI